MRTERPNPDDLLSAIAPDESKRGRLKVFMGASAGVGKTYAMLCAAHEQKARGIDVVIGYVECHKRTETEALRDGLDQVPLAKVEYKGAELSEVDVDAIIARNPALVLIDELPHTNAPGSRHAKRWQDIEEVLDAGIDVWTAVNIQHLESLNDVVAQVTGVRVQETVPDAFVDSASDIEVIDIPAEELRQRLRDGKVYVAERIQHALEGFFKSSNLTALRELALRRVADTVDAEMQRLRVKEGGGLWATRERVLVCLAPNRLAIRVVRAAARLGVASHAEMIALFVESDRQTSRTAEEHTAAREALELAEELGMEVVQLQGHDIVSEIISFAKRRNVTLIVVGKPIRPRWKEFLLGSVVDELVRASGEIDVHVLTTDPVAKEAPTRIPRVEPRLTRQGLFIAVLSTLMATAISTGLYRAIGESNVAMIYLLFVALSSIRCSRSESAIAATLSVVCFDFFFVAPRYTFAVSDARYLLVFLVMLTVGLVISTLTHRLRAQISASSERERRTASLYALSRQLAQGRSKREMARAAAKEIRDVFDADVAIFLKDKARQVLLAPSETGFEKETNENAVATWVFDHSEAAGFGTDTLPGASALYLPLQGAESTIGVLAFKPNTRIVEIGQRQLLDTFANGLGLALERAVLAKQSNEAKVLAESERIRSTLLSSISHDLRTPLTSITGAASSLAAGVGNSKELAETIYGESVRLNHQIQNLLDMTRLQSGNVELDLKWHAVSELVASALRATAEALGSRAIEIDAKPDLPLVRVDGLLIEKALINLIENAARYTAQDDHIKVKAVVRNRKMEIEVVDDGPGLDPSDIEALFKPGYRTPGGGYGLGLSVVKAVMDLHKGAVNATNVSGGGADFKLTLPLEERQPEAPPG